MLLLQYSRQAAYLQCKIISLIESKHCDCEKIVDEDEHSIKTHNSLPSTTIKMNMPDEIFLYTTGNFAPATHIEVKQKPTAFIKTFSPQHFAKEWIQPPRA